MPGRDLADLPKAHLHLHLEGAMRPATLEELAAEQGVAVPPVREFTGFAAFAGLYVAACDLLASEALLRRLVREVVEDAAADGVVWLEPAFYSPRYRQTIGPDRHTIGIVLDELRTAGAVLGVGTGLIVAADRTVDPTEAVELARVAAGLAGQGVVGFGLANDEAGHPPEPFAEAFAVARDAGLLSVPHGGELAGAESVIGCLDACGAHRVMHGIRAVEDPALLARLAAEGICLDVCPSSNVALSDRAEHRGAPPAAAHRGRSALLHQRRRPAAVRSGDPGGVRLVPRPAGSRRRRPGPGGRVVAGRLGGAGCGAPSGSRRRGPLDG